ncbi:hypothetical protein R3P38DRAFT_2848731 [Favolaschia claudopus]|uniref:NAD(P)-binding protein n=1 Tax=Favolaschia claudopus TaxID=2862362 RepID=A0AAW0DX20_9AGAR
MPPVALVESTNASYHPSYTPMAIFVGATSGVGQAMAEALARQTNGRAHIIIIGRSASAASKILAGFPKPPDEDGSWKHEFVACDATSLRNVRAVCDALKSRLTRLNYLVMTAGGPDANSFTSAGETEEGVNKHLVMRYFMRYLFTQDLVPLLLSAKEQGQQAHAMCVQGAGFGARIRTDDLGLHNAVRRSWKLLNGKVMPSVAAIKGMITGVTYNDGLVAYFATKHPIITFTHIHPGQVLTPGGTNVDLGWLFAPLAWIMKRVRMRIALEQDERAKYMLYALLDQATDRGGIYIRGECGDIVSAHGFDSDFKSLFDDLETATLSSKYGVLQGIPMKGYGGSDASVAGLIRYTNEVLAGILKN